jgi:hypothetical protein
MAALTPCPSPSGYPVLRPRPGLKIKRDVGVLRGDSFQILHCACWSNKASGLASDVPSEATPTPQL